MSTTTLRYEGGASLSFRDGSGSKRKVLRGEVFEVDADTAEILLTDPAVSRADDVPRGSTEAPAPATTTSPAAPAGPSYAELQARGKELGLKVSGVKRADLEAAIAAEEARLAEEAAAAQASSSGEGDGSGESPGDGSSPTGAVTLGDLTPGGRMGQG